MTSLRLAIRRLAQSPAFTVGALLTLALGIGASTAMFSLVNTLLLQPAPYPDAARLLRVYRTAAHSQQLPHSLPDFRDLQSAAADFAMLASYQAASYNLEQPTGGVQSLYGIAASAELCRTLGVSPALGRFFTADEQQPGRDGVAVLSDDCWRRRFGADPGIVGRSIRLDGEPVTVIGVMPESAAYPMFWGMVDLWRPLRLVNDWRQDRTAYWLNVIGRLRPGVALDEARSVFTGIAGQLAFEHPETNTGVGFKLVRLHESALAETSQNLTWLTFGLAGFVLLIACANLANLQLARAARLARTTAVRMALGAEPATLLRAAVSESLVLAVLGGGLGVGFAGAITHLLNGRVWIRGGPVAFSLSPSVVGFALLVSLLAALAAGVLPVWAISRTDLGERLKHAPSLPSTEPLQRRLRHALVIAEIALTVMLLSSAGLFLRGLQRFAHRDVGWRTAGLITGSIALPETRFRTDEDRRKFHERLLQRLTEVPGAEIVALANAVPVSADDAAPQPVFLPGRPPMPTGQEPLAQYIIVTPGYFGAMQLPLVAGQLLPADLLPDSKPVVMISESAARTLWPGENPIGKLISSRRDGSWNEEVIGVVRDAGYAADLSAPATRLQIYRPLALDPWGYVNVVVRAVAPATLAEPLRQAVASLEPDLTLNFVRTVDQAVDQSQEYFRLANRILTGFALMATLLSAIGLYGVVTALVAQNAQELGLRVALGAQVHDVVRVVLGAGFRLALAGIVIGVAGSFALAELLRALASELPAQDPWVIGIVSLGVMAIALVACWLPARSAGRADPMAALRVE